MNYSAIYCSKGLQSWFHFCCLYCPMKLVHSQCCCELSINFKCSTVLCCDQKALYIIGEESRFVLAEKSKKYYVLLLFTFMLLYTHLFNKVVQLL